jgi:hypothetical protein
MRKPGRVAVQEVMMQVDDLSITHGKLRNDSIDSVQVAPSNGGVSTQKVSGIITECWIIYCGKQNGPYWERVQECIQTLPETRYAVPVIGGKSGKEIGATNR